MIEVVFLRPNGVFAAKKIVGTKRVVSGTNGSTRETHEMLTVSSAQGGRDSSLCENCD